MPSFPYTGTWVNLMDNTTINVTNTTTPITIEAGGFRIFGNQSAALSSDDFSKINYINLVPNPASSYFSLNTEVSKVDVYSMTGQLVKSFKNQSDNFQYDIADLNQGIYLVKVTDANNNEKTLRLIKQ